MTAVPENLSQAYANFFVKTDHGKYFIEQVRELIDSQHQKAEKEITFSRDYVQRAKGTRDVVDHINSVLGGKAQV